MLEILEEFKLSVNTNPQIQRIVKAWSTDVLVEENDSTNAYRLIINNGQIAAIEHSTDSVRHDCPMKIIGGSHILRGLFEGKVNGIRANNEGLIAIYGPMGDQVKLDAIALILWGI